MKATYTEEDYAWARKLWAASGPHAPSVEPGRFYIANMAKIVARLRRKPRRK